MICLSFLKLKQLKPISNKLKINKGKNANNTVSDIKKIIQFSILFRNDLKSFFIFKIF
jgi:hypothetical protein